MARATKENMCPITLPEVGKSRWEQLRHFIPVSRETWRKLHKAGKAPVPEHLSIRCTVWDNRQIHLWLLNPSTYNARKVEEQPE